MGCLFSLFKKIEINKLNYDIVLNTFESCSVCHMLILSEDLNYIIDDGSYICTNCIINKQLSKNII